MRLRLDYENKGHTSAYFATSGGYAARDKARLEKRLTYLRRRHIEATLYDEEGQAVGGVAEGTFDNGLSTKVARWNSWYDSTLFE